MKYIDLDKGIYTKPSTGDTYPILVVQSPCTRKWYLDIKGRANCDPFNELDVDKEDYCELHGITIDGGDWPETKSSQEVKVIIDLLNDDLSKKFDANYSTNDCLTHDIPW